MGLWGYGLGLELGLGEIACHLIDFSYSFRRVIAHQFSSVFHSPNATFKLGHCLTTSSISERNKLSLPEQIQEGNTHLT